jgi:hypothetical protein
LKTVYPAGKEKRGQENVLFDLLGSQRSTEQKYESHREVTNKSRDVLAYESHREVTKTFCL